MNLDECIRDGQAFLRESAQGQRGLLVFVPGFLLRPADHATLLKRFESDEQFLGDDILPFLYDSGKWSNADPQVIARELATQIDEVWQRRRPKRLYIVAHSMGGLIARAALIHGIQSEQAWASKVTRLCLLESTNRGYRPQRWSHRFQLVLARAFGKARLARSMLVDSRFVLGVRLDWLNHFAVLSHVEKVEGGPDRTSPPETIQLLASPRARPVVLEDDSDDLLHCGNAEQRQIPHVNHYTIAMLADGASQEGGRYVPFEVIRSALFGPLRATGVRVVIDPSVTLVAFVVHGIRDYGTWLGTLEKEILKLDPAARVWRRRYPYFSILNFLRPEDRKAKVDRLVRDYADHRVAFPNAAFVCGGHSNGTYILANAMLEYRGLRFERVFLAGSVLPQEFDWRTIGRRGQVGSMRNDMANADIPVGFFCAALGLSPFHQDLGVGGFRGFTNLFVGPPYGETEWVPGGMSLGECVSRCVETR